MRISIECDQTTRQNTQTFNIMSAQRQADDNQDQVWLKQQQQDSQGDYVTVFGYDQHNKLARADAAFATVPEAHGTRRIGVALLGLGRMGSIHLNNLMREVRANLLYVLDASDERLAYARQKYYLDERQVQCVHPQQYAQIVEDARVEVVIVATPTYTHEEYTRTALEHNKHVLCEKPLADDLRQIQKLVDLANTRNLKLLCAFQRRYDQSFRCLRQQVHDGRIGQLRLIKTCSRDSPLPSIEFIKHSGGIFHDCLVHDMDVVIWIARELPVEVHAYAHCYVDDYKQLNDFDTVLCSVKFASGMMASIDISRVSDAGYDQRCEAYGANGWLKIDELAAVGCERHSRIGLTKANNYYSFPSRYQQAYELELLDVFNHIEGNKTLEPTCNWYIGALCKIIDACDLSARSHKPVPIEWTEEERTNKLF